MATRLDPRTKQELKELLAELGPDTPILFFSNILVIALAMVQGWDIIPLLWVYWAQSVIIGFFNWLRIRQLQRFSTTGFKIDGRQREATEQTKKETALFFLLHFGLFQLFLFIFLLNISTTIAEEVLLSAAVGVTLFLFNHFFSYRHNLKKDLASPPNIGTLMFFPYARIIPMHLVIFIGLWAGRGSTTELFFFLLFKTGMDLLMHIVQHVDWSEETKEKKNSEKGHSGKKRMTLKARIKVTLLLVCATSLALVVITFWVIREINR